MTAYRSFGSVRSDFTANFIDRTFGHVSSMSLSSFEMPNSRSKIIDESISLGFVIVKRSAQFESNSFDAVIRILLNSADPSLPVGHTKIYMLEAIGESLKLTNHSMELGTDRFSSSFIQMINLRIELQQSIIKFTLQHFEPLMKSPMIVDATLLSELIVSTHDKPLTETIEFVVEALSKISDSFSEDVEVSMPVEHALRDCLQIDGSPLGGISTDCVPHRGIVACQPTAHRCRNRDTGAAASPFCRCWDHNRMAPAQREPGRPPHVP